MAFRTLLSRNLGQKVCLLLDMWQIVFPSIIEDMMSYAAKEIYSYWTSNSRYRSNHVHSTKASRNFGSYGLGN